VLWGLGSDHTVVTGAVFERTRRAGDSLSRPDDRDKLHRYAAELDDKAAVMETPQEAAFAVSYENRGGYRPDFLSIVVHAGVLGVS
jgi:hypothetical protein